MGYPRSVTGVFNESDTAYLEHLFFSKLVKYSGVYYKLWRHLNETRDPTTTHLMAKLDRFIEHTFGPGYVVVNDFYSYRDHNFKQFPDAHQDSIFWMVDTHDCAGFNLWVLLNHCEYNTSFEVFDMASSPQLYEGIDFHSDPYQQRKVWKRRVRNQTGSFIPLTIGGALVVRQPEVHRTDIAEINQQQWRLALGFKVMRIGTIQGYFHRTALARDETFNAITADSWLPSWDVGAPLPSVYDHATLTEYWNNLDLHPPRTLSERTRVSGMKKDREAARKKKMLAPKLAALGMTPDVHDVGQTMGTFITVTSYDNSTQCQGP